VDKYYVTEEEIDIALSKLKRYGEECHCEDMVVFKQIIEGDFDEILQSCLNCGGTIQ
jgi:hypothetical protein